MIHLLKWHSKKKKKKILLCALIRSHPIAKIKYDIIFKIKIEINQETKSIFVFVLWFQKSLHHLMVVATVKALNLILPLKLHQA